MHYHIDMKTYDTAFDELVSGAGGSKLVTRMLQVNYQSTDLGRTTNILNTDTYALTLSHFPAFHVVTYNLESIRIWMWMKVHFVYNFCNKYTAFKMLQADLFSL